MNAEANKDLYLYRVSFEGTSLLVSLLGVDTSVHCYPNSNIDLVYFVWTNFLRFTFKNFAMVLSPRGAAPPELLFLRHFRFPSDGWKDSDNCDSCTDQQQTMLLSYHECDLSQECTCKMCTRQPRPLLIQPVTSSSTTVCISIDFNWNRIRLTIYTCSLPVH